MQTDFTSKTNKFSKFNIYPEKLNIQFLLELNKDIHNFNIITIISS